MTLTPTEVAWLDLEDKHTADIIRRFGVYNQYVIGDSSRRHPSFAYTTGLFGIGHPELLIVGVDSATAHGVLNHVAGQVRDGRVSCPASCSPSMRGRTVSSSRRCRTPAGSPSRRTATTSDPTSTRSFCCN